MTVSKSLLKYYENPGSELGDYEEGTDEPKTKVDPPAPDEDIEDTDEDETPPADPATPPAPKEISKDILDKIANPDANPTPKEIEGEGYEIEVDEFSPLTDGDIEEVVKYAEENGLTKEQAQAEIKRRESYLERGMTAKEREATKIVNQWQEEVRRDPLFATREIEAETNANVEMALNKIGSPELKQRFDSFYKHDIHFIRMMDKIGRAYMPPKHSGQLMNTMGEMDRAAQETPEAEARRKYPEMYRE